MFLYVSSSALGPAIPPRRGGVHFSALEFGLYQDFSLIECDGSKILQHLSLGLKKPHSFF
jgi:hypothetical protein